MMRYTMLTFSILLATFVGLTQNQKDSLESVLTRTTDPKKKIDVLVRLSESCEDPSEALGRLRQALRISQSEDFQAGLGKVLFGLGIHYHNNGNADSSRYFYMQALPYLRKEEMHEQLGGLNNNMALHERHVGQYTKALAYAKNALSARRRHGDSLLVAHSYMQLSDIHDDLGDLREALRYAHLAMGLYESEDYVYGLINTYNNAAILYSSLGYKNKHLGYLHRCMELLITTDQPRKVSALYNNLGNAYKDYKVYDSAMHYHKLALQTRSTNGWSVDVAETHYNMGELLAEQDQYDSAVYFFRKCVPVFDSIEWVVGQQHAYVGLGHALVELGQVDEGLPYLLRAEEFAESTGLIRLRATSSEALAKAYAAKGEFKTAYAYHTAASHLKDSLLNADNQKVLAEMETKYETAKKDLAITSLEKDKEVQAAELALQEEEIERKEFQRTAYAVGLGVALVLILVVLFAWWQKRKDNQEISRQKATVEAKNEEIMDSIKYAKRLQSAILPNMQLVKEYLGRSFVLYKPKDIVAGDFYWMQADGEKVWFAAADCTGHGVPGAMVSVVCANSLNRAFKEDGIRDPGELLDRVRELVIEAYSSGEEGMKDGMDIALCELDLGNRTVRYAGANNPMWVVASEDPVFEADEGMELLVAMQAKVLNGKKIFELKGDKQPIGVFSETAPFSTHRMNLNAGDCIYLFSDGYADQFGGDLDQHPHGKKFKYRNMKEMFCSLHETPMDEQREVVDRVFEDWKGSLEQVDDVCVIGVRV